MIYYGQFTHPKVDEYLHKTFFPNRKNGIAIEVGAYDGVADSSTLFFEKDMGWTTINVEASPTLFKKLTINRPNSLNYNYALTPQKFSKTELEFRQLLFQSGNLETGLGYLEDLSSEEIKEHVERKFHKKDILYKVMGISISDLILLINKPEIDLLVLDIEGLEYEVLKDLYLSKVLPKVICIEDNCKDIKAYNSILEPLGYNFHSKVHVNLHFVKT